MTEQTLNQTDEPKSSLPEGVVRFLPFLGWLPRYKRSDLPSDFIAGMTVAAMLVPQSMAYALLAGLPPVMGIYTSILPVLVYGLLGSSPVLTMGPTAITSVMALSILQPVAAPGSPAFIALAITLPLFLGVVYVALGLFRLGWVVNFLSQPVLTGYVNAAAIIIAVSQVQHLTGITTPNTRYPHELLLYPLLHLNQLNVVTLVISLAAIALLLYFRHGLENLLTRITQNEMLRFYIVRSGPLVVVVLTTLVVFLFQLDERMGVKIIGDIPSGLPSPTRPAEFNFTENTTLIIGAFAIAFVGFMEGISTAKTLASKRRQRVDPNQELFAMGVANIASAFSGGFVTTTSISRSAVNYAAGARTGMSSVITAAMMAGTLAFLAPAFYYLPRATLAAIIITAVINLIDFSTIRKIWRYSHWETAPFAVTFLGVFAVSIEVGIVAGIASACALHLWRTSRPYIAELGRIGNTEHYQNKRHYHGARRLPNSIIIRVDESLYFANMQYLEDHLRYMIAKYPKANYLILNFSSVNRIDASALQLLTEVVQEFDNAGITIYFTEIKSQLMKRLRHVNFVKTIGENRFFESTHDAVRHTEEEPDLKLEEYHI